jgi:hypothetical protein
MKRILLAIGLMICTGAIAQTINTFPYNEDFEAETGASNCGPYFMSVGSLWVNDAADGGNDWSSDNNGTGSTNTGPTINGGADYNPGVAGGRYMVTETSGCTSDTRNLESPWFDFSTITGGIEMNFAYHMYGADMGTMAVDLRTGLGSVWTQIVTPMTDNQDVWQVLISDLSSFAGEDSVQIRIVAATGISFGSDMAIDDFNVIETSFNGSISIVQDNFCFGLNSGELTATNNYGIAPITYSWDNGASTQTISGLAAGSYCVTMTDANGDVITDCATINAPTSTVALNAYAHTPSNWICTDSMGYLVIDSITGGVPTVGGNCGLSSYGCSGPVDSLQVGTNDILVGGTTYPSPLGNWYWGARHQMLYLASELVAAGVQPGNLSGLAFYIDNLGTASQNLTNWNIKVGCTPATDALAFNDTATSEVYPMNDVMISVGWNWYSFANPFYWNGSDNIIVETCFNNSSFTNNPSMACNITPFTSTVYYRADNSTVCGASNITGTSVNRPIVQFENCSSNPPYNYSYSWDMGSSADTTYVSGGSYVLTVADDVGCVIELTIDINESAPVTIDDAIICDGNPTDFRATTGFETYTWNTSETTSLISISSGGTYYVDVVDSLGCHSSDTAVVTTIPTPVISATSNDVMFGNDGYIDLLVFGNAWPFLYDWDNDGVGDNDDNEDLFGLDVGPYSVIVTDTNGCWSSLTITVGSQLSINNQLLSSFSFYPNPTKSVFNIQPLAIVGENVFGKIFDATGKLVELIEFNGNQLIQVDLSSFERGIYFIQITVEENTATTKILLD